MRDYFDSNAHTLDIRAFDVNRIRYNLKSLSLFIWRLESYPVKRSTPCYRRELTIRTVHLSDWQSNKYKFENACFLVLRPNQVSRKLTLPVSPRPMVSKKGLPLLVRGQKRIGMIASQRSKNLTGCYTFHPLGYDMPLFQSSPKLEKICGNIT